MNKEELLKYLIAVIDLIMHDKDYRFENRDGTWYSRESCRDLTNEEVFKELKSELMQLNSQVEQIADLEAKLADKDEEIKQLKEQRHIYLNRSVDECNKITMLELELQHKNHEKISFAVERLENVKIRIQEDFDYDDLMYWLNNQIKQLKEQK